MRSLLMVVLICGSAACGGNQAGPDPILRNAPKPDTGVMAGAAAAVAGAATLASPHDAAKKAESNKAPDEKKPVTVKENVPAGVLDRLDEKQPAEAAPKDFVEQAPTSEPPSATAKSPKSKKKK